MQTRKGLAEDVTYEKSLEGRERGSHGVSQRASSIPAGMGRVPGKPREEARGAGGEGRHRRKK